MKSGVRLRWSVFGQRVLHPAGRIAVRGRAGKAPALPPFVPPIELSEHFGSRLLAEQHVAMLVERHGKDSIAWHIEELEPPPPAPKPLQRPLPGMAGPPKPKRRSR
jgi:hypothetical protein